MRLILIFITLGIASCKKNTVINLPDSRHLFPPILYDTADTKGAFIVTMSYNDKEGALDMYGTGRFFSSYLNYWDIPASATITGWDTTLYAKVLESSKFLKGQKYNNEPITWKIREKNAPYFYFSDSAVTPYTHWQIPDSMMKNEELIIMQDSIRYADTILFYAVSPDEQVYFSYKNDTEKISVTFLAPFWDKEDKIKVGVMAITHQYAIINGRKYLFIKQYDFNKEVWFKK